MCSGEDEGTVEWNLIQQVNAELLFYGFSYVLQSVFAEMFGTQR